MEDNKKIESEIKEKLVAINRITKVVKGGRRFGFAALVVVGNQKGSVGIGKGKSKQVPDAIKKATEQSKELEERVKAIDEMQSNVTKEKAETELLKIHPDFAEIRDTDEFHEWAEEQPKWVQDALYENQDDPKSVVRVIDLYKIDNGIDVKGKRKSTKEAASEVKTKRTTKVETNDTSGSFRESDVQRMTAQEYEANSDAIMESIRSGKFIYDISGAAR